MVTIANILQGGRVDDVPFVPDGFNAMLPANGDKKEWYECYYCANATATRPEYCPKCYGSAFWHRKPRKFREQPMIVR